MTENSKETMLDYIKKSAEVIRSNLEISQELTAPLVEEYLKGSYKSIWIIASGSSYNGANCAASFISKYLSTPVRIITPFTFQHLDHDFTADDFVFVVSQSGCSTNSIAALEVIKAQGAKTIGVCADLNSDMKNYCDLLVDYGIGFETVHYVTLGVSGFVLFMLLFTIEAALAKGMIAGTVAHKLKGEIAEAADVHETVQKQAAKFYETNFLELSSLTTTFIGGIGPGQGIALEASLKISETFQVPVLALEIEEYLHGYTLQVNPLTTLFVIDVGIASKRIQEIYRANKVATRRTYLITNDLAFVDDPQAVTVDTKISPEILPLCYLPFFQYIAYKITADNNKWNKHPVVARLESVISGKTESYNVLPD